jgi:hypothetical protein
MQFARMRGWLCMHPYSSKRTEPGWPDLALVRRGRLVFAELKSDSGKLSQAQGVWLAALGDVPGVLAECWRPSDWDTIQRVLM